MNKLFPYILLTILVSACGTGKNMDKANTGSGFGVKDYAYIEKFHEGIRLKTKGRLDEAVASFQQCLSIKQDDDAVYFALSELELMRGNLDQSSVYILKAAELDPKNTWYVQELAYMYYEKRDFEKSVQYFKKLVEIEPRNVDWQFGYAGALQEAGKSEEAIKVLDRMEGQVGVNPELSIRKYELYMKLRKESEAIAEIERARQEYPRELSLLATLVDHYFRKGQQAQAISLLEELVKEDPGNGRAHLALAEAYRLQGEDEKAWGALKKAFGSEGVELDTKMMILTRILESSSFKIEPEAFELLDVLVAAHPNDAKAYSIKGDFLLQDGKNKEALEAYRKALEFDKTKYPIWNQVMIMEYQAGEFTPLYAHSKECLTLFPAMTTVYLLQGVSANQLKKYDEALEALDAGRVLIVNDKDIEAEFYGQTGEAYFGLKEYDAGKKAYEKAMQLEPKSALIRSNYAFRLANARMELDLAESLARQALEASPGQAQYLDVYGWIQFRKGKFADALSYFQQAIAVSPGDAMIADHMGDAYIQTGKAEEAVSWWKKAKELGSVNPVLDKKILDKKFYDPIN